jgi:hypothetical protein
MEVVTMYKVGKYLFKSKEFAESVEEIIETYRKTEFSVESLDGDKEILRVYLKPYSSLNDLAVINVDTDDVKIKLVSDSLEVSKQFFDYLDSLGIDYSGYKSIHTFTCSKSLPLKEKFSILLKFARNEYWGA